MSQAEGDHWTREVFVTDGCTAQCDLNKLALGMDFIKLGRMGVARGGDQRSLRPSLRLWHGHGGADRDPPEVRNETKRK